jgi:hypothetical protein
MTFPAFRPREYGPLENGTFPVETVKTLSGRTSQTVFSDLETGITTTLSFDLTTTQWQQLIVHFEDKGTVLSFDFATETLPAHYTLSGYRWRYAEPPTIEDDYENFFRVTCSFRSDFYPSFILTGNTLVMFMRAVETPATFTPSSPPPAPTITIEGLAYGVTNRGLVDVSGLQLGASWEYSTDSGSTWTAGTQSTFSLAQGTYAAGAVRVRQVNAAGPGTAAQNASTLTVAPSNSITFAFSCNAGATATGTVTLPRLGELLQGISSHAGWFRLYSSATAAANDASRARAIQVPTAAGVNADVIWPSPQMFDFWPTYDIRNTETPQTNVYQWRFVNDGASGQVVITLVYYSKIP